LITTRNVSAESPLALLLTALDRNRPAYVDSVDWSAMPEDDGKRLRELGLCEGAQIELLHRAGIFNGLLRLTGLGNWGAGAYACRVGRMMIAMRANHAAAIAVRMTPLADEGGAQA
jgi:ferrous iron transport protein A